MDIIRLQKGYWVRFARAVDESIWLNVAAGLPLCPANRGERKYFRQPIGVRARFAHVKHFHTLFKLVFAPSRLPRRQTFARAAKLLNNPLSFLHLHPPPPIDLSTKLPRFHNIPPIFIHHSFAIFHAKHRSGSKTKERKEKRNAASRPGFASRSGKRVLLARCFPRRRGFLRGGRLSERKLSRLERKEGR